ncbi:MAG TPA: arylesterase [Symbiobacteriaceae bacterium]|nr:arylesterase [Symbiobacteriaceae bacterium]
MRKQPILSMLLVVLAVALGMAGCSGRSEKESQAKPAVAPVQPAAMAPVDRTGWPVIVAFGDSLTFGQGVDPDKNYPKQLQAELDRLGYQYRVINSGISGDTTAGGVNRVESVLKLKPQIVILELGANDGLQGKSVKEMRNNLAKLIERFQQEKVTVVLAGMQIPPNYGPEYTGDFQQTFVDLAAQYRVPLIPFFLDGAAGKPELNNPDGIHPTAEGYVYVVKNVLQTLQPLLKK